MRIQGSFPLGDVVSSAMAQLWSGGYLMPSQAEMERNVDAHYCHVAELLKHGDVMFPGRIPGRSRHCNCQRSNPSHQAAIPRPCRHFVAHIPRNRCQTAEAGTVGKTPSPLSRGKMPEKPLRLKSKSRLRSRRAPKQNFKVDQLGAEPELYRQCRCHKHVENCRSPTLLAAPFPALSCP